MLPVDLTVSVLVEQAGRFLIIREYASGSLVYTQPGGHIEAAETPEEAAEREALEESGCEVRVRDLLGVYRWQHPQSGQHFLRIVFVADLLRQRADLALDQGIDSVHWWTADDLQRHAAQLRAPVVSRCIDDFLAGTRQPQTLLAPMRPLHKNVPAVLASAAPV